MNEIEQRIAEFGREVARRRKALRLTQAELAELAEVSPTFVFELENGKPTVSLNRAMAVSLTVGLKFELRVRTNE